MDTYDYNEDSLSIIAKTCSHAKYKQSNPQLNHSGELSCSGCSHWNGRGCSKNHLESIAAEMYLD